MSSSSVPPATSAEPRKSVFKSPMTWWIIAMIVLFVGLDIAVLIIVS